MGRQLLDPVGDRPVEEVVSRRPSMPSEDWLSGGWFGKRQLRGWAAALGGCLVEVDARCRDARSPPDQFVCPWFTTFDAARREPHPAAV